MHGEAIKKLFLGINMDVPQSLVCAHPGSGKSNACLGVVGRLIIWV